MCATFVLNVTKQVNLNSWIFIQYDKFIDHSIIALINTLVWFILTIDLFIEYYYPMFESPGSGGRVVQILHSVIERILC